MGSNVSREKETRKEKRCQLSSGKNLDQDIQELQRAEETLHMGGMTSGAAGSGLCAALRLDKGIPST